jgi:PAS domain S-box-containing protein
VVGVLWKSGVAPLVCGVLALLLWSPVALALDPSLDINQYAHIAWTGRNGFVNGEVYTIAQTADGYLWLGTQSGVVRFDGLRAVPLTLRPGQQLPNTAVGALLPGRDGTLWIGTLDGLVAWKDGQLTGYPELARRTVVTLLQDRNGTVWAGGFGGPTGKLCAIRGENTRCYGDDGRFGAAANSLYEDTQGSLWVGGATGLWRWNPGPPTQYVATPIPGRQTLAQGDRGSDLIVAADSVRQIVGNRVTDYPLRGVPSPLTATSVLRDHDGGLWIGTSAHGLVHSYKGKTSLFTHNDGLSSDQVYALFEDREGMIWVATSGGLDQFRELPVTSLSVKEGLSSATVTSVLAARDGSVWIGTADGLNRWNDGHATIYRTRNHPGLPGDSIQSLYEDERGRVWVSGSRGLAFFENGNFSVIQSVGAGIDHAIAGDEHGGVWLSRWLTGNNSGLAHLVDGKIIEQAPWPKLGGGPGTGLVPDPGGGVWTGLLSGGIAYFRAGQVHILPLSVGESDAPKVFNLQRGRDGALWVATEKGLSRVMDGRVATLTTENGLPCNAVHWIMEDDLSSDWVYTPCGLLRIPRSELDAWTADPRRTIQATALDAEDGVRLIPMLKGFRPFVTKAADGKIWFVNSDTVSFFDPSHIGINTLPPPVHIEQITANRKRYIAARGLRLPPLIRNLTIDYTALSLAVPQKVHFKYKLEGQDPEWREVINERQAQYTNLPPGNYRFRVTASNNSGVWNEAGDVFDFSIAPAYYQANWFRALLAAAVIALLWTAYQFRVRQLQRESKQLRDVIETIPAMAWTALPDGSNEFVNRRWAEYTGLSGEATAGAGWTAVIHPEDRQPYSDTWRTSVATGKALESEARFRCSANGEYRWFLARGVPLRDEHGKILRWYGTLTDIEDRKRAEEALKRNEAYLADAQRLAHTGAWAGDATTQPLYWSEEVFRFFGFDPQDGLPHWEQPLERVHPEDREKFLQAFQRSIQEKLDSELEFRIVWPDGTVKYVYGVAHPVLDPNGGFVELVGTVVDITERKRAEEERERLRQLEADLAHINRVSMMGELAASIAHEVNQPLAGIVGNGSACLRWLAANPPDLAEIREAVKDIVRDGKRAGEVIARIRALTKRTAPPRETLDVNELIREVLALVSDEAKKNSVMIRTQFANDLSPVSGDRVQLQQVLLNLVMNAMEAMSGINDRARQLVITTRNIDASQVQVTVEDSGTGLDATTMGRIFEPFYTTKSSGMGMGLSISRSIMQNHGGRLWATGNDGPGTSFHFTLPNNHGGE